MFKLEIETANAAFDGSVEDAHRELARILRQLADRMERDPFVDAWPAIDLNGNTVGIATYGFQRDRLWTVTINGTDEYKVLASTASTAGIAAGNLWRAEHSPGTPEESGGRVHSVHAQLLPLVPRPE